MPQHLNPLADGRAANVRAATSLATALVVAIILFGGFYLASRWNARRNIGALATPAHRMIAVNPKTIPSDGPHCNRQILVCPARVSEEGPAT